MHESCQGQVKNRVNKFRGKKTTSLTASAKDKAIGRSILQTLSNTVLTEEEKGEHLWED